MAVGVHQRHRQGCRGGRCECSWEAFVYSGRDGKKIRKTFPSQAAARAWRDDTRVAVRKMLVRAPTSVTLAQAAQVWFKGAREGTIRTRSGDAYKPAAIRAYEIAFRLRVKPKLGRAAALPGDPHRRTGPRRLAGREAGASPPRSS